MLEFRQATNTRVNGSVKQKNTFVDSVFRHMLRYQTKRWLCTFLVRSKSRLEITKFFTGKLNFSIGKKKQTKTISIIFIPELTLDVEIQRTIHEIVICELSLENMSNSLIFRFRNNFYLSRLFIGFFITAFNLRGAHNKSKLFRKRCSSNIPSSNCLRRALTSLVI